MKVKFWSCPLPSDAASRYDSNLQVQTWADHQAKDQSELRNLCREQVQVLQQAYMGQLTCEDNVYDHPVQDTGIRFLPFEDEDLHFVDDALCSGCEINYPILWEKYAPQEAGVMKVVLCKTTGILGVSGFPWEEHRGTMFDYRTLPKGGMFKYDMGKTMVHEFGHYMGLMHTFQNGCQGLGDEVDDTSKEMSAFFGCPDPSAPPATCGDGLDDVHNFMDYADDRCMCAFTPGQRDRLTQKASQYKIFPEKDKPSIAVGPAEISFPF